MFMSHKWVVSIAFCSLVLTGWGFSPRDIGVLANGDRYVKGHLMVGVRPPINARVGGTLFGAKVARTYPEIHAVLLEFPTNVDILKIARGLLTKPGVTYAEPDRIFRGADYVPNDLNWASQWGPSRLECEKAWELETGSPSVVIAIIDSGVNYNHPDLAANYAGGFDYVDSDADPMDVDGHGTLVAGIAAAVTDNTTGMAGVGFNCHFMALRVGTANAYPESLIVAGINYATSNGAQVINLSLGGYGQSSSIHNALVTAAGAGVVICAAAGNDATTQQFYPAAYSECVSVGATGANNTLASFSNRGSWVTIAAPGTGILSTNISNGYSYQSGTSMACPMVAGTAALVYSALGGARTAASAAQVRGALFATDIDFTNEINGGRENAYLAVLQHANVPPSWVTSGSKPEWTVAVQLEMVPDPTSLASLSIFQVEGGGHTSSYLIKNYYDGQKLASFELSDLPPSALTVNATGSKAYIAVQGLTNYRIARITVDSGALEWGKEIYTNVSSPCVDICLDHAGNLLVLGSLTAAEGGPGYVLIKTDAEGEVIWTRTRLNGYLEVLPKNVRVDPLDNVYVSGSIRNSSQIYEYSVIRYSSAGTFLGEDNWPGPDALDDFVTHMAVGGNLGGFTRFGLAGIASSPGLPSQYGQFSGIAVYDPSTGPKFQNTYIEPGAMRQRSGGIEFDPNLNVYVSSIAQYGTSTGPVTLCLRKFDPNGLLLWAAAHPFGDTNVQGVFCTQPVHDLSGNIYVGVFLKVSISDWDSILVKFDSFGNFLWAGRYESGPIYVNKAGDLLVVLADGTAVIANSGQFDGAHQSRVLGYKVPGGGNTATGNLAGTINLDQYSGSGELTGIIEFREPGTSNVLFTKSAAAGNGASYSATDIPQGRYDVSVKMANWLRQSVADVAITNGALTQDFTLTNGDCDGSNSIDVFDLNTVLTGFAGSGPNGDLDYDGQVTVFDLNLVLVHFGQSGDL